MKKCILIGALAALMLFAFTACEQAPGFTMGTHVLSDVQYVSGPLTYYEGETFDPSAYTIRLVYADNQAPVEVNGAAYLSIDEVKDIPSNGSKQFAVNYVKGTDSATEMPIFRVTYYDAGVTVDVSDAVESVASTIKEGDAVSLEGVIATFTAADGTERAYDTANLTATYRATPGVLVVSNEGYPVTIVKDGKVAAWSVSVDPTIPTVYNKLVVRWEDKAGKVVETPYIDQLNTTTYTNDYVTLKVYATVDGMVDDTADELSDTEYTVYGTVTELPEAKAGATAIPIRDDADEVTIVYNENPSITASFSIFGLNYAKSLAITEKASKDVVQGGNVADVIEKVIVTYADGTSKPVTDYELSMTKVSETQATGSVKVYCWVDGLMDNKGSLLMDDITINVTAKS